VDAGHAGAGRCSLPPDGRATAAQAGGARPGTGPRRAPGALPSALCVWPGVGEGDWLSLDGRTALRRQAHVDFATHVPARVLMQDLGFLQKLGSPKSDALPLGAPPQPQQQQRPAHAPSAGSPQAAAERP
ncbi:unnamed protein product, partial [Prorocentrum cordatum]